MAKDFECGARPLHDDSPVVAHGQCRRTRCRVGSFLRSRESPEALAATSLGGVRSESRTRAHLAVGLWAVTLGCVTRRATFEHETCVL